MRVATHRTPHARRAPVQCDHRPMSRLRATSCDGERAHPCGLDLAEHLGLDSARPGSGGLLAYPITEMVGPGSAACRFPLSSTERTRSVYTPSLAGVQSYVHVADAAAPLSVAGRHVVPLSVEISVPATTPSVSCAVP